MNLEPNQLPPRRSRHTQRKVNFSFTKWVRSGLVVFGAVFFGVILVELYQAQVSHEAAKPSTQVLTVSEPTTDNIASAGQAENAAAKEQGAAVSTPTVQETKTTETKVDAKLDPPSVSTPSVQPASQPSATGEPKPTQTASVPVKPTNPSAASASAPTPKPKAIRHVVQKGETLYMLSRKYYGNNLNVSRIAKYNGFHANTQLTAGKIVMVPLAP
ncbi:LysM peptidoglycan-binding domain-containing protein [uncultured Brevibacillus sp.]|uniref:LysM peptidoglycan-binding domain-containing protein n=1 Tax=uncultured Brevibacillus sp. TaxID=169970 RepID=UPI0025929DE3|nr:LysM peptidoglycan-binding domain-containing protein [uncultured Brevibacillus sp.]